MKTWIQSEAHAVAAHQCTGRSCRARGRQRARAHTASSSRTRRELGGLGRFRAFARLALHEITDQRRAAPDILAERPPAAALFTCTASTRAAFSAAARPEWRPGAREERR
jgi:hypothetical protein